jgi:hypothetical protein
VIEVGVGLEVVPELCCGYFGEGVGLVVKGEGELGGEAYLSDDAFWEPGDAGLVIFGHGFGLLG